MLASRLYWNLFFALACVFLAAAVFWHFVTLDISELSAVASSEAATAAGAEASGGLGADRPGSKRSQPSGVQIFACVVLAGLVLMCIAYGVARPILRSIRKLDAAVKEMEAGRFKQRVFTPHNDEIGSLAASLTQMGAGVDALVTELRESDRRQATVLGGMIEGVLAIDNQQHLLLVNNAAGRQFGFHPLEAEGRPLLEMVRSHPLHQAVAVGLDTRQPQRLEIDWEGRALSVQVTPLVGSASDGAVIVLHDTTDLRRLESLRRDFVANVSHELKTPLSSIKAYAETLLGGAVNDPETSTKFLGRIEEQADRLDLLIQDMLRLARIESAQQPFEIEPVAIDQAVAACIEDLRPKAEQKQITLTALPDHPQLRVKADTEGMRLILENLVDNAIKYTPEGGEVRVLWGASTVNPKMTQINVTDTGPGIPEAAQARVFERFYRVDKARSRELGGTGLGLSIVKHLVQSFGGTVAVSSPPGEGSTFTVTLPTA
ncbi:Alkaline phosphatase synthesis sensor protein PhoR [Pseudobythopirellula maris]|uniref:histidine kinase n=1 Tax=Pseudobythopirellula maris TaxID=2527991 RepID=A0A5C5ZQQ3_9BACT|nr:HAMP domain-containing sensor histidine kinase [Pseudobythopirellula maris]TWT89882.1 Alkaline phosphatase synthesis sensor protein PhoR [Pseudobythopirellula maris]